MFRSSLHLAASIACLCAAAGCSGRPEPRDFMKENADRWQSQVEQAGGSFEAWAEKVAPFHADVRKALADRPEQISGIIGLDGFLFFRRSLEVLAAGDYRKQGGGRDPYPAVVDFHRQLKARGIDLLFCPIPVKAAAMPDTFSKNAPTQSGLYVNPYTIKLLAELGEAGVESVDLMPLYEKERDAEGEPFYMPLDTHWSNRCIRVTAKLFAERIRNYKWFPRIMKEPVRYTTKDATCKRRGDVVHMLPENEKVTYRPMELAAQQVVSPDGELYRDDKTSPILFLGDSYSGVYHFQDCKNAGITAHIAKELGMPMDLVLGLGMGPEVRKKVVRSGEGALVGKRLVIWSLSERDLYNYKSPWEIIPMP